jgi:hypothetical protein
LSVNLLEEAEELHRRALELTEKVLGREHPDTLDSMNSLALLQCKNRVTK